MKKLTEITMYIQNKTNKYKNKQKTTKEKQNKKKY